MKALNGVPVFRAGESQYYWEDVLLAAIRRGDWPVLEQRAHEELVALHWQHATGVSVSKDAIEAAAAEFRYARGLVSADEMRAWLDDWGLSAGEWMDWVRRDHARTLASASLDAVAADYSPSGAGIAAALPTTFVCSDIGARFARELASRAAVKPVESSNGGTAERSSDDASRTAERIAPFGSVPAGRLEERAAVVGQLDDVLTPFGAAALSPAAIRRELEARHLDWIRVHYRSMSFVSEHAAREASWCVRSDGLDVADVAARAGATLRSVRCYLCDVDAELRTALIGARAGEVIGPARENGGFVLHYVDEKQMPSLDDLAMRRRLEDSVLQKALASAVHDRIQWQVAL